MKMLCGFVIKLAWTRSIVRCLETIKTSESHNSRQCDEWLLYVRSTVNAVSYGSNTLQCVLG